MQKKDAEALAQEHKRLKDSIEEEYSRPNPDVPARRWQLNAGRNPRRPPAPHIGISIGSRVRP